MLGVGDDVKGALSYMISGTVDTMRQLGFATVDSFGYGGRSMN